MDRCSGKVECIFSHFTLYYIKILINEFCVEIETVIMTHRF